MSLTGQKKTSRGDTYIGVLIALSIFLILSQAVVTLSVSVYDLVSYTRARISARHLALEAMELVRNAPYDEIGTIGGIPPGIFEQERVVSLNGQRYTVRTRINYIDDVFDGVFPIDTLPTDYKRVKVDVSWGGFNQNTFSEISLATDVSPRGIETTAGGGTLSVLVFDAQGQPLPQARVEISAGTNPPINTFYFTSNTGRVTLPGAPACNTCYQIIVTKEGMSTDRTYSSAEVTNPTKPQATVISGQLTEISFNIDTLGSLNFTTYGGPPDYPILPNQIVRLRSEKTIGTDGVDDPVYKFDQELVTNSSGNLSIDELEWGNYHVSLPTDSTYKISGINPLSPFSASPGEEVNLQLSLVPDTGNSLLARFENTESALLASVAATIKDDAGYEASSSSGVEGAVNFGQVFFDALENKIYSLIATASGYLEYTGNITISGDVNERIILTPQ